MKILFPDRESHLWKRHRPETSEERAKRTKQINEKTGIKVSNAIISIG